MRTITAIEADRRIHRASQVPVLVVPNIEEARSAYRRNGDAVPKNLKASLWVKVVKLWRA